MLLRTLSFAAALAFAVSVASAHFTFLVVDPAGATASFFLSETLSPDDTIDVAIIKDAKLFIRQPDGKDEPLSLHAGKDHALHTPLPGSPAALRLVHGTVDLGVSSRGESSPYLLVYHPKTILGNAFSSASTDIGKEAAVELRLTGKPEAARLQLVAQGKPQPEAEVTLIEGDGDSRVVTTDADGFTPAFAAAGRVGAWARFFENRAGEQGQKKYDQIRHYATLVFAAPTAAAGVAASNPAPAALTATRLATMPEAASSFGAVALDGWLYIYGGHIVKNHSYSTAAVSGKFHRLNLKDGTTWESLPGGPPLQGLNLVGFNHQVYRVGGMEPRNKPGDPSDIVSLATVARFDPATSVWQPLADLPEPRSSHDIAIVGHTLVVVGGWTLTGEGETWLDHALTLDLNDPQAKWEEIPEPFHRRALIAATFHDKVYVIGGFDDNEEVVYKVDILDPATGQWTSGPNLPGAGTDAFGPAACVLAGHLYVSLGDGTMYQLDEAGKTWSAVGRSSPRIVHRIVPSGGALLVIGGATKGQNSDAIESLVPSDTYVAGNR